MKEKTYKTRKGVWVGEIESGVEKKKRLNMWGWIALKRALTNTPMGAHHFPQMDAYFMLG